MTIVDAVESKVDVGALSERAAAGPVLVRQDGQDACIVLSALKYESIRQRDVQDFNALCEEMSAYAD